MIKTIVSSKLTYFIVFIYIVCVAWWIYIQLNSLQNTNTAFLFNWSYGLIALSGGIIGIYTSLTKWGGFSSVIGRGLIYLSLGLLGQWFGLQVWTYYNVILGVETPYPSLADAGYFLLIPAYTVASLEFANASGAKFSLKTPIGKVLAGIIPIVALSIAYFIFIKDIGIDLTDPLKAFLDLGYPLGEVIPVSIAIYTLTLANSLLGGTMKTRIVYLVIAFSFQFFTEYLFLYRAGLDLYVNGGFTDLCYATSYLLMSLALISFREYKVA